MADDTAPAAADPDGEATGAERTDADVTDSGTADSGSPLLEGLADASDEEAAAIAAAIAAYLRDREAAAAAAAAAAGDDDDPSRRSWAFAGRLAGVGIASRRPPATTPTDAWSAAGRADRF